MHDGMPYDPIQGQGHEPVKRSRPSVLHGTNFFLQF